MLDKFDLARLLVNPYSMGIIEALKDGAKNVQRISQERQIPISACYRKVHELEDANIVSPDHTGRDGRMYRSAVFYRSNIRGFNITYDDTFDVQVKRKS